MSERELLFRPSEGWADLDVRVAEDGKGDLQGIVSGIAVPWEVPTRINRELTEVFSLGAFDAQIARPDAVFLARNHIPLGGDVIGRLSLMRNDARGLYVEGKVSATPVGQETLTLLKDRVLDSFSVGFLEGVNKRERSREHGEIVRRVTAKLREVAIVLQPAYADALVTGLRGACPTCAAGGEHTAHEGEETELRNLAAIRASYAEVRELPAVPRAFTRSA